MLSQTITNDDLIALVSDEVFQPEVVWKLGDVQVCMGTKLWFNLVVFNELKKIFSQHKMITDAQVTCGSLGLSTATVRLIAADGVEHTACSDGTGPVDAAYKAIDLIVKV